MAGDDSSSLELQEDVRVQPNVNLPAVETVLGHTFSNPQLGDTALSTWRRGFSRLEFLGDSILGLAVFSTAEVHRFSRQAAIARVSNNHLDEVFRQTLSRHTSSNSGDVVEAIIGAVHLDGGYVAAARVATALCLPECEAAIPPIDVEAAGIEGSRSLSFVGAAVLSAAVADELCRENPDQSHRWFSEQRMLALTRRHLAAVSIKLGYSREGDLNDEKFKAKASDGLEAAVARQFLTRGWDAARTSTLRIRLL